MLRQVLIPVLTVSGVVLMPLAEIYLVYSARPRQRATRLRHAPNRFARASPLLPSGQGGKALPSGSATAAHQAT